MSLGPKIPPKSTEASVFHKEKFNLNSNRDEDVVDGAATMQHSLTVYTTFLPEAYDVQSDVIHSHSTAAGSTTGELMPHIFCLWYHVALSGALPQNVPKK